MFPLPKEKLESLIYVRSSLEEAAFSKADGLDKELKKGVKILFLKKYKLESDRHTYNSLSHLLCLSHLFTFRHPHFFCICTQQQACRFLHCIILIIVITRSVSKRKDRLGLYLVKMNIQKQCLLDELLFCIQLNSLHRKIQWVGRNACRNLRNEHNLNIQGQHT